MKPWEQRAHSIIAALAAAAYRNANPPGRKRHRAYTLPDTATHLVTALGVRDDREREIAVKTLLEQDWLERGQYTNISARRAP